MKHSTRYRRRFFFLFLLVAFIFCLEMARRDVLENLDIFVEREVSRTLGLPVGIKKMKVATFQNVVFKDIFLGDRQKRGFWIEIESAVLRYRPYDILTGRFERIKSLRIKNGGILYNNLKVVDSLNGIVMLQNGRFVSPGLNMDILRILNCSIKGEIDYLSKVLALSIIPITGVVSGMADGFCLKGLSLDGAYFVDGRFAKDMVSIGVDLPQEEGTFNIYLRPEPAGFTLQLKADHIKLRGIDLLTTVEIYTTFNKALPLKALGRPIPVDKERLMRGEIESSGTIVNYKPFREVRGGFYVEKNHLAIERLSFGERYNLSCGVDLTSPYWMKALITLKDTDIKDILMLFDIDREEVSGKVNGYIEISGPLFSTKDILIEGLLKGEDLIMGDINYLKVGLKGAGLIIRPVESYLRRGDRFFDIKGFADLKGFRDKNLFKNIEIVSRDKAIVWNGWDITKGEASSELSLHKNIGEDFSVGFKTFTINDDPIDSPALTSENGELELEYRLKNDKSLKLRLLGDEELFCIEHKIEF